MLEITVPSIELYDESKDVFYVTKEQKLRLEHSLISVSKWESKWHKPFLSATRGYATPEQPMDVKTTEEVLDYIRCMTLTPNVDSSVYRYLNDANLDSICEYINDPMTATVIHDRSQGNGRKRVLTSEVIYYYMTALQIPFECEKWHLNRLLTLISVCAIENGPKKSMSNREIREQNNLINKARREKLRSRG